MSCNTGTCNFNRYPVNHQYVPYGYSPMSPVSYVKKEFKSSVPRRLRKKGLDLAFDQCFEAHVIIKRELPDKKKRYKYTIIDVDSCVCKKECEYKCICVPCNRQKKRCRKS